MSNLGRWNCHGDKFSTAQRREKGSQSPSTVPRERRRTAALRRQEHAPRIMISAGRASLERAGTARRASERGRHREGCVKFKHLSYLIKKNADSTSSASQIPLLQKRRLQKTQSPLARAFAALEIPSAAKPRHTWEDCTTASPASHCLPPSSKAPGHLLCGPGSRIRKQ